MSDFNLNDYENVKARKLRFYTDHPDGRITVEQVSPDKILEYAVFKAYVYLSREDQAKGLPKGTGHALELREKNKSTTRSGKEYESVNYTSWTENAEESAIGRALDNAGYASNGKPSKEEMIKVQRHQEVLRQPSNEETPQHDWKTSKPTSKQIEAVLKVATFKKEINGVEETEKLKKEVTETWTAKQASDYLGNKTDGLEGARK